MKKTLLICAMAAGVVACTEHRDEYVTPCGYSTYTSCATCTQTATCDVCNQQPVCDTCVQPVLYQQPKQVFVVLPPQPQPVIEQEIIYQPQPSCGCKKCGCKKHSATK